MNGLSDSGRDECRSVLLDLLKAEKELRERSKALYDEETRKINLWQKRILVAEKIGDRNLAWRAAKRKVFHESARAMFDPQHRFNQAALPQSFVEARETLKMVESHCGLVADAILRESSLLCAFSLFDRILFLLENLELLIDE